LQTEKAKRMLGRQTQQLMVNFKEFMVLDGSCSFHTDDYYRCGERER
jgi:hypothetical protein